LEGLPELLVIFYKPCSVSPILQEKLVTVIIYLQSKLCLFYSFISFRRAPLPLFGLLARGVYRVPPMEFPTSLRHCGTFKDTLT